MALLTFVDKERNVSKEASLVQVASHFWVVIENFADLTVMLDASDVQAIVVELCSRIAVLKGCALGKVDICGTGARVAIVRRDLKACFANYLSYDDVLIALSKKPYRCKEEAVVLALSAHPRFSENEGRTSLLRSKRARECWSNDMRMAVVVHEAITENQVFLLYQGVSSSIDRHQILYNDCRPYIFSKGSKAQLVPADKFIPSLDRLGLTRLFDVYIMQSTIELLRNEKKAVLGCSISALSSINDLWWQGIQQTLLLNPQLASRLVVELREYTNLYNFHSIIGFIESSRRFGCKISTQFSGSKSHIVAMATIVVPDIIKIKAVCGRKITKKTFSEDYFYSILELTSNLVRHVVVSEIETKADFTRSRRTGARWFQGNYISKPSITRCQDGGLGSILFEGSMEGITSMI